ncbi:MAG: hypothetical protein CL782_00305 [Chloroflexi bacterium]|nr:hypothetical protein [Chloroflexota bacterium]|tara:strand:- start:1822 stop:3039 length:1218 start_codon:yes stop_codon:yes gene_type:complete
MEIIIIIIVVGAIWFVVNQAKKFGAHEETNKLVKKNPPKFRIIKKPFTLDDGSIQQIFEFQMRGSFPPTVYGKNNIAVAISLFDYRDMKCIMSILDWQQEHYSRFFLSSQNLNKINFGSYFPDWTPIGFAFEQTLIPAKSGQIQLLAKIRFLSATNVDKILIGEPISTINVLASLDTPKQRTTEHVTFKFSESGYEEAYEDSIIAQEMALKIAVHIALIDGELHKKEGALIKSWIEKYVGDFTGEEKEEIKTRMNTSMAEAYQEAKTDNSNINEKIETLRIKGTKKDYFETIELLIDIMTSDEEAHRDELAFINDLGSKLGVSISEIQNLKNLKIINDETISTNSQDTNEILGITSSMNKEEVCEHLTNEFLQWNSRIEQLEGEEKVYAQNMIDLISESRINNGC